MSQSSSNEDANHQLSSEDLRASLSINPTQHQLCPQPALPPVDVLRMEFLSVGFILASVGSSKVREESGRQADRFALPLVVELY